MKLKSIVIIFFCVGLYGQLNAWPSVTAMLSAIKQKFSPQQSEKVIWAPRHEVELCRKIFGLQAECSVKPTHLYAGIGGLIGACTALMRNGRNLKLWQYGKKFSAWLIMGGLVGAVVRSIVNNRKTKRVRALRTLHYFPEDYMQRIPDLTQAGPDGYITEFVDSPHVAVGENEIKLWHGLLPDAMYRVCHRHIKTGRLIAELPYYSPEARQAYANRGELNVPISYDKIQEMNPSYWRTRESFPYAHSYQQDMPNYYASVATDKRRRVITLSRQLDAAITRGNLS